MRVTHTPMLQTQFRVRLHKPDLNILAKAHAKVLQGVAALDCPEQEDAAKVLEAIDKLVATMADPATWQECKDAVREAAAQKVAA